MAGASAIGLLLVILPCAEWFWAISGEFMIYTIYIIYFLLYSYHLKAFSSTQFIKYWFFQSDSFIYSTYW